MVKYNDASGQLEFGSGTAPLTSMSAVSAVSNGSALNGGVCRLNHTMAVTTSAGVSAGVVQLQGSFDGTNWFNMPGSSSITTNAATTTFAATVACPASFVRASITTTITGGTITAVVGSA